MCVFHNAYNHHSLQTTDDDSDDCPWIGTVYPLRDDEPSFGIYSIGRELSNGTRCEFILTYRIQFVGNGNARYHQEKASCTGRTIILLLLHMIDRLMHIDIPTLCILILTVIYNI